MSIIDAERVQQSPSPQALGLRILSSYYNSFAVVQGNFAMQTEQVFPLLGAHYRDTYGLETYQAGAAIAAKHIDTLRTPKQHANKSDARIKKEFTDFWPKLNSAVENGVMHYDPRTSQCEALLAKTAYLLLSADDRYMREWVVLNEDSLELVRSSGRPSGAKGGDPRKSFVREHVLGAPGRETDLPHGRLTVNDPVLDTILGDARELLVGERPVTQPNAASNIQGARHMLAEVAGKWEGYHPGEQYLEYAKFAGTPMMSAFFNGDEFLRR